MLPTEIVPNSDITLNVNNPHPPFGLQETDPEEVTGFSFLDGECPDSDATSDNEIAPNITVDIGVTVDDWIVPVDEPPQVQWDAEDNQTDTHDNAMIDALLVSTDDDINMVDRSDAGSVNSKANGQHFNEIIIPLELSAEKSVDDYSSSSPVPYNVYGSDSGIDIRHRKKSIDQNALASKHGIDNKSFEIPLDSSNDLGLSDSGVLEIKGDGKNRKAKVRNVSDNVFIDGGPEDKPSIFEQDTEEVSEKDIACGLGCWKPSGLQNCRNMACFTASYSVAGIVTSALGAYINSQITTLEKQFNFSSSVSGVLMSCNDIGYILTTLVMSYYARRIHIPRALTLSSFVYGVSGLVCTIPYFGTRDQIPTPPPPVRDISQAASPASMRQMAGVMCDHNRNVTDLLRRMSSSCQVAGLGSEISPGWRTGAIAILAVGMVIQGVAKSPRQSFLGTFVDDNVPKTKTTMYLGTMVGLAIFGPALAFVLGGVFAQLYVTLEETSMTPFDPRWIGAWWLGFMVFGIIGLFSGIPIICFPRRMRRNRQLEMISRQNKLARVGKPILCHELKGFLRCLLRLMLNPVFVCVTLATGLNIMALSGLIAFLPKYIETQFTVPVWRANITLGIVTIVSSTFGTMFGGCLTSRLKMSPVRCLQVAISCVVVSTLLGCLGIVFGCEQPDIISHGNSDTNIFSSGACIENCFCIQKTYFPVCGADGRSYFSPCHAGCQAMDGLMTFTNCTCLSKNDNTASSTTATAGLCSQNCQYFYPYVVMAFLMAGSSTMVIMPIFIINIRSVKEADKPFAIGLSAFATTLLGWLPGPIIFGILVDTTCLVWRSTPCGGKGACALHDLVSFRFKMHGLVIGLRSATILLLVIALVVATCTKLVKFEPHTEEYTVEVVRERSENAKIAEKMEDKTKKNDRQLTRESPA